MRTHAYDTGDHDYMWPDPHEEHEYQLATEHGFHAVYKAEIHHFNTLHAEHVYAHLLHSASECDQDIPF
jgi:hypothetical protein